MSTAPQQNAMIDFKHLLEMQTLYFGVIFILFCFLVQFGFFVVLLFSIALLQLFHFFTHWLEKALLVNDHVTQPEITLSRKDKTCTSGHQLQRKASE